MAEAPDLGARPFRVGVLLTLLVACFVASWPALEGRALSYDDEALLEGTADSPGALHRSALSFFTGRFYYAYLPVYGLTYWIDGKLGATASKPLLFHLQNVLWHAAASYVVFLLLGILVRDRWGAFLGALLFAVHPLHVESVAWIASRKDVVSGFLCLAAWLFALRAEERRLLLLPALLLFLLACLAKASAVVLPGLLLAALLLLPRYRDRRALEFAWTLPFWVVGGALALVHVLVGKEAGVVSGARPYGERFLGLLAAWGGAIQRTLLPLDLSIDYPEAAARGLGAVWWPALLLLAALLLFVLLVRRNRLAAFGVAAFFVALLPFNNVLPSTAVLAADRYLYLSLFGAAAVAAWAVRTWKWGGAGAAVFAVFCLALSCRSALRFSSDEELWTRTIAARDDSALAYINRGIHRTNSARLVKPYDGKLMEQGALDLKAGYTRARFEEHRAKAAAGLVMPLFYLRDERGALEQADNAFRHAAGDSAEARRFRANVRYDKGIVYKLGQSPSYAAAAKEFLESARLWSRYEAWYEGGVMCLSAGLVAEGRYALERAAALDRTRPEPYLDLASAYRQIDDREAWKRALEEAERRAPRNDEVVVSWIDFWLDDRSPNYAKAEELLARLPSGMRKAASAKVDARRALYRLRRGDVEEAKKAADQARETGLKEGPVLYDLAQIYVAAGQYDVAVRCYRDSGRGDAAQKDAVARALALKAAALLRDRHLDAAEAAMREALAEGPTRIQAGAAPLEGEIADLAVAGRRRELLLLAAAAVAGDVDLARGLSEELLAMDLPEGERRIVYRLRALVRAYVVGDLAGAEDDLRPFVADPKDAWARIRLAQVLTRRGLSDGQGDAEARRRGRARLDEAVTILDEAVLAAPDFAPARLARGEARFAAGDQNGAKADYLALRERGQATKEVCLREAALHRLAYVQGGDVANLEAAANLLERALDLDPNDFEALFELGNVFHNRYDRGEDPAGQRTAAFNQALLWYRRAMALNPRVKGPRVEWGRMIVKAAREATAAQEVKSAHDLLSRAEAEAPDVIDVWKERVRLILTPEFQKEDSIGMGPDEIFERASKALAETERLDPNDPELPELRALYHRRRGWSFYLTWAKLEDGARKERARALAIEDFRAAIVAWPDDPENVRIRERLREIAPEMIVVDEAEARKAYEKGLAALDAKKNEEAVKQFKRALALFPEPIDLHFALATALRRAGKGDEACQELQIVANHAEADRYPESLYELGFYHLARGEKLVGRPWLERYVATMERLGRADEPLVRTARNRLKELSSE